MHGRGLAAGLTAGLALLVAAVAGADVRTTVTLDAAATVLSDPAPAVLMTGVGGAKLDLAATGSRTVRGQLVVTATLLDTATFDVERAYVRARLPGWRLTAGKTRLSWGEGLFFNAGDILFGGGGGGGGGAVDLTASEFQVATDWLVSGFIPLGPVSYLEPVVLPRPLAVTGTTTPLPVGLETAAAGARLVLEVLGAGVEAGYLYDGAAAPATANHRGYLLLSGGVAGVDWHLTGGSVAAHGTAAADLGGVLADALLLTAGLATSVPLGPLGGSLALRLEAGVRPRGAWQEAAPSSASLDQYGVYLFPEIGYSPPGGNIGVQARSVVSPVDASAVVSVGGSWNILQGLTLSGFASAMLGDTDDLFGWERTGALSFTLLTRYIYGSA